jgi:hypothetical protein
VSSQGDVIGLNTAMIAGAQAICFATGIDTVRWVVGQLFAHGRVKRAFIGVSGATVAIDRRQQRAFELEQASGVRIVEVQRGSPASVGGLEDGDLLIGFDGAPVTGIDALQRLLDGQPHRQAHCAAPDPARTPAAFHRHPGRRALIAGKLRPLPELAMRLIHDTEVAEVITMRDAVAAMAAAFEQFGNGAGSIAPRARAVSQLTTGPTAIAAMGATLPASGVVGAKVYSTVNAASAS